MKTPLTQIPALAGNDIHVWRVALDAPVSQAPDLLQVLSPAEQARARQYYFWADCQSFVLRRAWLRLILGGYCQQAPETIVLSENPFGKPCLTGSNPKLSFNYSHSGNLAFYAIASGREVGIDVERIRPLQHMAEIVQRHFSEPEKARFTGAPAAAQVDAFYWMWTRKEAYVKARGQGLSLNLETFSVLPPETAARANAPVHVESGDKAHWTVMDVGVPDGYCAALAAAGRDWTMVYCQPPALGPVSMTRGWTCVL